MVYELWDADTRNIIYTYPTEAAALAEVAEQVAAYGCDAVATWVLLVNGDAAGEKGIHRIADGEMLAERALHISAPEPIQRTAD